MLKRMVILMDLYEENTHPFIIKVWLEDIGQEDGQVKWRGHVTHIPSGERRYIEDLEEIMMFIAPYLEKMGVKIRKQSPVRQWLRRLERR